MKQLYSAQNALEAHDVRLYLESQGVDAKVVGDNSALEAGFSFTPGSAPAVYVAAEDFDRAAVLVQDFFDRPEEPEVQETWKCSRCGQIVEAQFDACWKCELPRGDGAITISRRPSKTEPGSGDSAPPAIQRAENATEKLQELRPAAVESTRELWLEVGVVLSIAWFPFFCYGLIDWLLPLPESEWPYIAEMAWRIVSNATLDVTVLYIMYRSLVPWSTFGIKRPRIVLDVGSGALIWLAEMFAFGMLYSLVATSVGSDVAAGFFSFTYEFPKPASAVDYTFLLLFAASNAFSEELAMRGYLVPRLEQLSGSSWKSVGLTSLLFASYHLYQGIGAVPAIFVTGIVFGIAFCWTRRLWPVVIAHAILDMLGLWPTS